MNFKQVSISLKVKLASIVFITLAIVFISLSVLSSMSVKREVYEDKTKDLQRRVRELGDLLDNFIETQKSEITILANSEDLELKLRYPELHESSPILESYYSDSSYIHTILLLDNSGQINFHLTKSAIDDQYLTRLSKISSDKLIVESMPVSVDNSNDYMITFTSPVISSDGVIGQLIILFNFTKLTEEHVLSRQYGKTGYSYITSQDGMAIAHKVTDLIMTPDIPGFMTQIINSSESEGIQPYVYGGEQKYAAYHKMHNVSWIIVSVILENDLLSTSYHLSKLIIIVSLMSTALILIVLMLFLNQIIIKRMQSMENMMSDASDGNLTVRLLPKGSDEIDKIFVSFNTMLDSFSNFLSGVNSGLGSINQSSIGMSSNTAETASAVSQIQSNITSMKKQIENQNVSTTQTAVAVEELTRNIDSLNNLVQDQTASVTQSSASVEEITANITSISKTVNIAENDMLKVNQAVNKGSDSLGDVLSLIEAIVTESEQLLQANTLISNITSQTNLLSMNAAIEAAHAGEFGKGFAVVADEIRKLAEESSSQSKSVKKSIDSIMQSIDAVSVKASITNNEFTEINHSVDSFARVFNEIESSMDELNSGSNQILLGLKQMKDSTSAVSQGSHEMKSGNTQIIEAISHLREISEITSGSINEVSLGIEEITKAITEIDTLSQRNSENTSEINDKSKEFRID